MNKNPRIQEVRPQGPIRITIPAAVAYDLNAFQKGLATVLGRLGCQACCSGFDITFQHEREFVINERMELAAVAIRESPMAFSAVTATLPTKVSYNLEQVQKAVANIADRLGCAPCCSGFDITFLHERELLVDEALNVRAR